MNFKEMFGRYVSDELPEYIWNAEVSKPFIDQNSLFGSFVGESKKAKGSKSL